MKKEEFVSEALRCITAKVSVIPVAKTKVPLIPWKEFQERLATESEIKAWSELPDVQLGIVTGQISNLTVVDVEAGGDPSFLPQETAIVKTGGGGWHYYFEYCPQMKNKARIKDFVDIRSEGGYVVAPGSESDKGKYEIQKRAKWAKFPLSLFERPSSTTLGSNASPRLSCGSRIDAIVLSQYPGYGSGQRNDQMVKFIGWMLREIHPADWEKEVWPIVLQANQKNTPPLSEYELRKSFESIMSSEKSNPQSQWNNVVPEEEWKKGEINDALAHMADVAEAHHIDLSKVYPCGLDIFDKEIRGGFVPGDMIIIAAPSGEGKCLGLGTKIIMHDGSIKNVEDIVVGDSVIGPDSKPKKVLALGRGKDEMFRIVPTKGEPFVCNSKHILSLVRIDGDIRHRNMKNKGKIFNISVEDYLKKSKTYKHVHKLYRVGVEFEEKELFIDPYFLGVWLGDGTGSKSEVTTPDKEIVDYLEKYSKKLKLKITIHDRHRCPRYNINAGRKGAYDRNCILNFLKNNNLLYNKHIPKDYKINSRKNRLKLLAGLLDTDGYLNHNGYEIITKYDQLKDDILFLARSLGLAAYAKIKVGRIKSLNFERNYWRINISGDCSVIPLKIKRKKATKRKQLKNVLRSGFKVEPLGQGDYYGFELDRDHLYLLGDFTVTHNTSLCQHLAFNFIKYQHEKVLFFSYEVLPFFVWEKFSKMGLTKEDVIVMPMDHPTGNMEWIEKKIKEGIERFGVKMIVIDDLTYLTAKSNKSGKWMAENYSLVLTNIVLELKRIAIDNSIIIISPTHMRKRVGGDRRKRMDIDINDIANSAGIFQKADLVFMMKREETLREDATDLYTGYTLVFLAKNRRGSKNPKGYYELLNDFFVHAPDHNKEGGYAKPVYKDYADRDKVTEEDLTSQLQKEHEEDRKQATFLELTQR